MFDDLEKTCSAILEKTCSAITFGEIVFGANVGENVFGDFGENLFGDNVWRNRVRRFGETWSAQLWRLRIGVRHEVA